MSAPRQVTFFTLYRWINYILAAVLLATSCTVPKENQLNKPFVYKVNVSVEGNHTAAERQRMKEGLENQLDDSLKARTVLTVGFPPIYYKLPKPPVYDSLNLSRSRVFMTAFLNANGYFNPAIHDTVTIDTVKVPHWFR